MNFIKLSLILVFQHFQKILIFPQKNKILQFLQDSGSFSGFPWSSNLQISESWLNLQTR